MRRIKLTKDLEAAMRLAVPVETKSYRGRFPDDEYVVDGELLRAVELVMKRLNHYEKISFHERRDMANLLDALLHSRVQPLTLSQLDEKLRQFP